MNHESIDESCRFHIEEAASHLQALRSIYQKKGIDSRAGGLDKIIHFLKRLHRRHGGIPHD